MADSYYCGYYCMYAPSWIFTAIAKGAMLCPIDPAQIDPYKPDVVFPGWVSACVGAGRACQACAAAPDLTGARVCVSLGSPQEWSTNGGSLVGYSGRR